MIRDKRKIFIIAYGGGHVAMMVPLIRRLRERPDVEVVTMGLTTAAGALQRAGIPYVGFKDFLRLGDESALEWGSRLAVDVASNSVTHEETIAYLGLSYVDLEARLGPAEAARAYEKFGRQAFLPLTVMKRILEEINPDLVVATSAPRAERATIEAAAELGIRALCLVDLFASTETRWVGKQGYADRVCVLSEGVRTRLLEAGRRSDEVVVTGNPAFDQLVRPNLEQEADEFKNVRKWGKRSVILWASQPEPTTSFFTDRQGDPTLPRQVDRALIALLERHPDWQLVLRPHPSENVEFGDLPSRVELSQPGDDLAVLLKAVDVVICMSSTVGIQAALLDKPVISLEMSILTPFASLYREWSTNSERSRPTRRAGTLRRVASHECSDGRLSAC